MNLKEKRVLVVGLGRSGLAAAFFLRSQGAQVTVSDVRPADVLAQDIPALLEAGIMVETGGHGMLTFRRQDLIIVSPGVPLSTPELLQATRFGMPIIGELELATPFLKGRSLAITGSNGKTTTTTLAGQILQATGMPVQVGGNIGVPVVALIEHSTEQSWQVLELSSFQLETTTTFHPQIAVILNITPDHLDRHGTFKNYAAAKERIFQQQTASDALVLNADNPAAAATAAHARSTIYWFSRNAPVERGAYVLNGSIIFVPEPNSTPEPILALSDIPLKGEHNVENVLAAVCATRLAGATAEIIRDAVRAFKPVEHRLEFVASICGVDYYNDSKATNVDSAAKAIAAFPSGIHLILGGKDKNSDYTALIPLFNRVRAIYTIGTAAAKIEGQLAGSIALISCETLANAVSKISQSAQPGDIALLAPACSSFDQFKNYEQRGQAFKQLVQELAEQKEAKWQNV